MSIKNPIDRYYFIFVCLALLILFIGLGSYGLAESSEARYAEISREMFLSGDYLNPQLLGIFHFHKPPITYYITTLGYRIFGVNEFGARFFLQIAVAVQLLLIYGLGNLLFKNKKIAFLSGLIYFSMPIVLISSRNLTTDAYLATFIMAAIYSWQYYTNTKKVFFLYLFYALLGVALLTKGPVAILFILVYIISCKVIFKDKFRINIHHILGIILCLAIGASWYILVMIENPKLWTYFIEKQIAGRMTGSSFSERSKPFWYFIPIVTALLLPWLIGLVPNLKNRLKSIPKLRNASRLLFASSVLLILMFSIFSTKLSLYILPVFWMIAIFIAANLNHFSATGIRFIIFSFLVILSLLFTGLLICWYGDFEFINISTSAVIVAFLVNVSAFVISYYIDAEKSYKPAVIAATFGAAIILIGSMVLKTNDAMINSTRNMVHFINNISEKKDKTILVHDYLLRSIPFYSDARFITLKSNHRTTNREVQFQNNEEWKQQLWDIKEEAGFSKLKRVSKVPNTFLLLRNRTDLNDSLQVLTNNFNYKKTYPKWTIFYNK